MLQRKMLTSEGLNLPSGGCKKMPRSGVFGEDVDALGQAWERSAEGPQVGVRGGIGNGCAMGPAMRPEFFLVF